MKKKFQNRFYMFSLENGVEAMDLDIDPENEYASIDECPFTMVNIVGGVYDFRSDDFTNGPDVFVGSTDPYELRSYIMRLFITL